MRQEKKYKGIFLDKKTNKYYVSTTFTTKDGYQIKKCKRGFDTAKKAETWKNQMAIEYSNSTYSSITGGKVGISKLIDEYIQYRKSNLKPLSLSQIKLSLEKYFAPYFQCEASDIEPKDIVKFYTELSNNKKLSNNSRNFIISITRCFIEYLDTIEAISGDIYHKFKKILQKFDTSLDKKEIITFAKDEVDIILDELNNDNGNNRMYHLLFSILAYTGCRIGEALALKIEDLNVIDNTIFFYKQVQTFVDDKLINANYEFEEYNGSYIFNFTKANTTKNVLIPEWLKDEILEYHNAHPREYLFETKNKKILNRRNAVDKLNGILIKHNLPKRNLHAFRHFHTSQLYEMGLDPKYIAERLGHTDETTSMKVYKHLSKEKIEKENTKLLEFIS